MWYNARPRYYSYWWQTYISVGLQQTGLQVAYSRVESSLKLLNARVPVEARVTFFCLFVCSFVRLFVCTFVRLFVHSFVRLFVRSFMCYCRILCAVFALYSLWISVMYFYFIFLLFYFID